MSLRGKKKPPNLHFANLRFCYTVVAALVKGTERLGREVTPLTTENCILREANETREKRRRAKKNPINQGVVLNIEHGKDNLAQKEVD